MIAETPRLLLWYLLGTTALGAMVGFCISQLIVKSRARKIIDAMQEDYLLERKAADEEVQTARESIDVLRKTIDVQQESVATAKQREEALETHSKLQAQRIRSLESQLASYEDQQLKLQRDFASYKSDKSRELEVARNTSDKASEAGSLPLLDRHSDTNQQSSEIKRSAPIYRRNPAIKRTRSGRRSDGLSQPLSRELDIPSLAESELPDSVDDLDFDGDTEPDKNNS